MSKQIEITKKIIDYLSLHSHKDDHLINVEKDIVVGARLFLKDKSFDNILFFPYMNSKV